MIRIQQVLHVKTLILRPFQLKQKYTNCGYKHDKTKACCKNLFSNDLASLSRVFFLQPALFCDVPAVCMLYYFSGRSYAGRLIKGQGTGSKPWGSPDSITTKAMKQNKAKCCVGQVSSCKWDQHGRGNWRTQLISLNAIKGHNVMF